MITCFYLFLAIWQPVHFNIDFKTSLITFKSLSSLLANLLIPYSPAHTWQSSGKGLLCVSDGSGAENKGVGTERFLVRALRLWDELLMEIRAADSLLPYKSPLKTSLSERASWFDLSFILTSFIVSHFLFLLISCTKLGHKTNLVP